MLLNGCVSDLTFDAWRAGELEDRQAQQLVQHVEGCASCLARQRALTEAAQAFELRADRGVPLMHVRVQLRKRTQRRRLAALSGFVLAAACMLMFVGRAPETGGDRLKGGASLGFYVRRAEQTFRWHVGQAVHPGDQLRFTWYADRPVYVAIFSLDARGLASVYFPRRGEQQARVPGGEERDLPLAVQLDESVGVEHLYAVGCESQPELEALRGVLERSRTLRAPGNCELVHLMLTKEPLP